MDCRLVDLPLPIKGIVKDGVIYLNTRHPWVTLESVLEGLLECLSNPEPANAAT